MSHGSLRPGLRCNSARRPSPRPALASHVRQAAIAAHGVVLKVWLLFVLAAEAPAVAAQVLCALT